MFFNGRIFLTFIFYILLFVYIPLVCNGDTNGIATVAEAGQQSKGFIPDIDGILKNLFFAIVQLIAYLISVAVGLIEWSLSPTFMDLIRSNAGIYAGWRTVRDVLNMFFIFFLLYSAFCTVFQISRYHIRNTWVMIIVMALLVNFSWPIARVLIDVSNVAMTWLMDSSGTGGGGNMRSGSALMSTIGNNTRFAEILIASKTAEAASWMNIFMGIIIGLLFLIVVMAVAALLVIRVIALALLLVFASAGFTMAAFPMTSSYANKWWNHFIKYLATGPVLLFILILSISILQGMGTNFINGAEAAARNNGVISGVLPYVVSLIILWTGIMTVGAMGDGASSMVLGAAGKARGKLQSMGRGGLMMGARASDRAMGSLVNRMASQGEGVDADKRTAMQNLARFTGKGFAAARSMPQRWKNYQASSKEKYDNTMSEVTAHGVSAVPEFIGGDKNAMKNLENKKVADMKKKYKDDNIDLETLMKKMESSKTKTEQRALAEFLADHKDFGKGGDDKYEAIQNILSRDTSDKLPDNIRTTLERKLSSEGKAHIVLSSRLKSGRYKNSMDAYEDMFARMGGADLGKQEGLMKQLQNSQDADYQQIRGMIRTRVRGNAQLAQKIRENASDRYMNHATGVGGILT